MIMKDEHYEITTQPGLIEVADTRDKFDCGGGSIGFQVGDNDELIFRISANDSGDYGRVNISLPRDHDAWSVIAHKLEQIARSIREESR